MLLMEYNGSVQGILMSLFRKKLRYFIALKMKLHLATKSIFVKHNY